MKKKAMSSNSQATEAARKRIDRLFLIFSAFYGQLWRSQFKSDEFLAFMKNEWVLALHDIEEQYMSDAVNQCRQGKEFPPTLPQFIDLCRHAKKRHAFRKKAEYPKGNPDVAHQHLARMKALLK